MENIKINAQLSLTPYYKNDSDNLIKYLNDTTVYENMLVIPYPYTIEDAEWFLDKTIHEQENGIHEYKAIRFDGELIGGIGFKLSYGINSHKDEIAYWLASPFRNKGIVTKAIIASCQDAFIRRRLKRIEAIPFDHNAVSSRVLEKVGFKYEGTLRNFFQKKGEEIDVKMYSLLPEDLKISIPNSQ